MAISATVSVQDLLGCTRPILFENNDDIYSYWLGATCFIVEYMSFAFVVTANHCFRSHGEETSPESILIQQVPGGSTFLPLSTIHNYYESMANDAEVIDIAIARIATEKLTAEEREKLRGFRIESLINSYRFVNPNATFIFRGYPYQINSIEVDINGAISYNENYEMHVDKKDLKSVIRRQAFSGDGSYVSRSTILLSHKIRFGGQPLPVDKVNGLSGSPVFQLEAVGENQRASLAGIITNANSEVAHFLDAITLFKLLNEVVSASL
ncbi:MAG: hypothetical protein ACRYFS_00740 [Janthinobacterium lividum]